MTPDILTKFIINTLQINVKDLFTYTSYAWGNITAKFGSTVFYQNTNFDADADIVIVPDTAYTDNKSIDAPLDSEGNIKSGTYEITYTVKVEGELAITSLMPCNAPGASPFVTIEVNPAVIGLEDLINAAIADYGSVQVKFYDGDEVLLGQGRDVVAVDDENFNFDSVTLADFADIAFVRLFVPQEYEKTFTYTFCDITPESSLCVTHNCYSSQLSVLDDTVYPATLDVDSRELTIQYPRLADGSPVADSVVTETASNTIGPNIWSGNYTVTNVVVISWEGSDGLTNENTITTQVEHEVDCDASLCNLYNCINSLRAAYLSALRNGSRDLAKLAQMNFVVMGTIQLYKLAVECEKTAQADALINELQTYLGENATSVSSSCNCGCGESGSSSNGVPAIIYPLYSTPSSGDYVPTSRTVNGHALSANVTVTKSDVGLGNVPNVDATDPNNITQDSTHRFATDAEKTTWNAAQAASGKDASNGYAGLTLLKINFKNVLNTFTSFFTNSNTAARTYTFQDRNGTIADDTDLSGKQSTSEKDATGGYAGLTLFKINFKNAANTFTSFFTNSNTAARTYTFQDRDGTIVDDTQLTTALATKEGVLTGSRSTGTSVNEIAGTTIYRMNTTAGVTAFNCLPNNSTARKLLLINEDGAQVINVTCAGFTINGGSPLVIAAVAGEAYEVVFDGTAQINVFAYQQ